MTDENIRVVTDEQGVKRPALDYTGNDLYDRVGKVSKGRGDKKWTPQENKRLKALVEGKRKKEVDWARVAQQLGRTEFACYLRAKRKRYMNVAKHRKHKTTAKTVIKEDNLSKLIRKLRKTDKQIKELTIKREKIVKRITKQL